MIRREKGYEAYIKRSTKVLFRIKGRGKYLLTNEVKPSLSLTRVFETDLHGRISMEGLLMGSIFAHDPYIIPELEKIDCTFEELNPQFFERNPVVDGLLGQAVGDAFGVPVEFLSRREVREINLRDMVGCDSGLAFKSRWNGLIPAGAWSDDTSMTVAAMSSIIGCGGEIDYEDIMKQFLNWWERAEYTCLDNFPFGLGSTVAGAFEKYHRGVPALWCGGSGFKDNGNGALMRMFPFSMYCILNDYTQVESLELIRNASRITHGHEINLFSCFFYTLFLNECIRMRNPKRAYQSAVNRFFDNYRSSFSAKSMEAHKLLFREITEKDFDPDCIPESGYVVDSLTVAVYSILHTDNYKDAVMMAVNFGYDTDTNAAITGSIAGAMYGSSGIPQGWLDALRKKEELIRIGEKFSACIGAC